MSKFEESELKKLFKPGSNSTKTNNGQVTIIAGSRLFHGPPLVTIKVASRVVDMVFLSSPEPSIGKIADNLKSQLSSFIWVPWEDTNDYIKKSDACLIGPGFMRHNSEKTVHLQTSEYCDESCMESREITKDFLTNFPDKKWVIDGGSLQIMEKDWIPIGSILTPNKKEYKLLFGDSDPIEASNKYKCTIVLKGEVTYVYSDNKIVEVHGGNAGLTKGGTGDVQAGLTAALFCKNDALLSASAAAYYVKKAADNLFKKVGFNYNSQDLADEIPQIMR
jgi:NAD(P)H-hydrate epimerase